MTLFYAFIWLGFGLLWSPDWHTPKEFIGILAIWASGGFFFSWLTNHLKAKGDI